MTIKGYYENGTIRLLDKVDLKNGEEINVTIEKIDRSESLKSKLNKYWGSMKVYGSTEAIDEYLKDCRSE